MSVTQPAFLFLSKECPVLNTLASYQALPYQSGDNDGAFIIRLIELNTFFKHQKLFCDFTKATGYLAPYHFLTPEELVLLLIKSAELIKRVNEKHRELKDTLANIEASKNSNQVGSYHQLLAIADNIAYQKKCAENKLNQFQKKEAAVYALIALLNPLIKQYQEKHPELFKPHLNLIQQIARFQSGHYQAIVSENIRCAIDSLSQLTAAINTVIDALNDLPIQRRFVREQVIPHDPINVIRLAARRIYYRPEGEPYRDLMTIEEYEKRAIKEHDIAAMPQKALEARQRHGNCTLSL